MGPRAGQKLFTLQTVPAREPEPEQPGDPRGAAHAGGFSLHAGLDIQPHQREKLERLCRYVSRPPIAVERLALTSSGEVRHQLKTPYRDGTTHIASRQFTCPIALTTIVLAVAAAPDKPTTARHVAMCRAQRLRRVFGIEIDRCARCQVRLRVIASIEEPKVIARILAHIQKTAPDQHQAELPLGARATPRQAPQQARLI